MMPVVGALLVAVKQRFGDSTLIDGAAWPRAKHLPMLFMSVSFVLMLFGGLFKDGITSIFGVYSGWLFLRYIMPDADFQTHGDNREEFALHTLFPPLIKYVPPPHPPLKTHTHTHTHTHTRSLNTSLLPSHLPT
jgi:hypothetical protein